MAIYACGLVYVLMLVMSKALFGAAGMSIVSLLALLATWHPAVAQTLGADVDIRPWIHIEGKYVLACFRVINFAATALTCLVSMAGVE